MRLVLKATDTHCSVSTYNLTDQRMIYAGRCSKKKLTLFYISIYGADIFIVCYWVEKEVQCTEV